MVKRCRPLLQQIAKHGDCFEHVQSNRVHNTDLKHRRLLHGTRTVLAVNLRHSLKKTRKMRLRVSATGFQVSLECPSNE